MSELKVLVEDNMGVNKKKKYFGRVEDTGEEEGSSDNNHLPLFQQTQVLARLIQCFKRLLSQG